MVGRGQTFATVRAVRPSTAGIRTPSRFSHLEGPDAATGVTFVAQDASGKYLGVPLSRQPEAAATAIYSAILRKVEVKIARWSGFRLSLLGRAHVAKQLLASIF
ncbi:hypothetical protein COCOBI_07-3810 [Coccomyxa sp. Obi]|nr:hypothetical protein COCOBI_07-3810 [Coccomyxa sp. Obi]